MLHLGSNERHPVKLRRAHVRSMSTGLSRTPQLTRRYYRRYQQIRPPHTHSQGLDSRQRLQTVRSHDQGLSRHRLACTLTVKQGAPLTDIPTLRFPVSPQLFPAHGPEIFERFLLYILRTAMIWWRLLQYGGRGHSSR